MRHDELLKPVSESDMEALDLVVMDYEVQYSEAEEYLAARGIDSEVASTFRLGVVGGDDVPPDHERYRGMLSIPYLTEKGMPLSVRFRCMKDHDHRERHHGKYNSLPGEASRMYNIRQIFEADRTISITEGECFRGDAEVLTEAGWRRFDELERGVKVAQYAMDGTVSFVRPLAYVQKRYSGPLIRRSNSQRYTSLTTPGHRLPAFGGVRDPHKFVTAREGAPDRYHIPRAGVSDGPGLDLSNAEIAFALAVSADASVRVSGEPRNPANPDGPKLRHGKDGVYYVFGFKKARKADRLARILDELGVEYRYSLNADGMAYYLMSSPEKYRQFRRGLPFEWLSRASAEQLEFMLKELEFWDGNLVPGRNQSEYSSKYEHNAKWVQTLAHLTGRTSTIMPRSNQYGSWFKVSILHGKSATSWQSLQDCEEVEHDGDVYCVKVSSGAILVRIDGSVSVSGNCDAITLSMIGIPAVALPGVNSWKPHHKRMLAGFSRVWVWGDPDEAGVEFGKTICRDMPQARRVPIKNGDVNETYLAEGEEALWKLIGGRK